MGMLFKVKEPKAPKPPEPDVVVELDLTPPNSKGVVYLKANGATIMGFKDGRYCLYSDARNHSAYGTIKGLVLEGLGFIERSPHTF